MLISFLASLPGNGSNTSTRAFQLYTYPSIHPPFHMKFPPCYPAVSPREYMEQPPSCHPILSDGYEIHPSLVAMVRASPFSGRRDEFPYAHLQEFEENCSLLIIPGMNQNTLRWKLFPFSLTERVKTWYYQTAMRVGGDWIQLKDEFCLFIYPVPKVIPCRRIPGQLSAFLQHHCRS